MTRRTAQHLLGALVLTTLASACGTKSPGTESCDAAKQCGDVCCAGDLVCVAGVCLKPCDSGVRCGPALECCGSDQECFQGDCKAKCPNGPHCGADGNCCAADQHCTEDGLCQKTCNPNCTRDDGSTKECGSDGCGGQCPPGCGQGESCTPEGRCEVPLHTGNDTCGSARPLADDFVDGVAVEHGDTSTAKHDVSVPPSCFNSQEGNDVVYSLLLTERKKVTATVLADEGSPMEPIVDIRTKCTGSAGAGATGSEIACNASTGPGAAAVVEVAVLPPGTYTIWVSSQATGAGGAGKFLLTVTLADPDQPPPANDTCAGATALDVSSGHATVTGNLLYASDDSTAKTTSCSTQPMTGADVVYKLTVTQGKSVSARMAFDNPQSSNYAALYLRTGCSPLETELACKYAHRTADLLVTNLDAGTYFLYVDTSTSLGEPFTLNVDVGTAPANDKCGTDGAAAQVLTLNAGTANATGDTTFASSDATGAGICGYQSLDVVYKVHFDVDSSLTLTVTPAAGSSLEPLVYIRAGCENPTDTSEPKSLACGYSTKVDAATAHLNRIAPGDYFIWVGGYSNSGPFQLAVTSTPVTVPANDSCTTPQTLQLDGNGKATVIADSTYGLDDYQATSSACRYSYSTGADLVYKVTLPQAGSLSATVSRDPSTSTITPVVYIRTTCASTSASDENACAYGSSVNPTATAVLPLADATTYYIVVDGSNDSSGPFKLVVTAGAAVQNDTCANPTSITISGGVGTITGDTALANADDYGSCQPGSYSSSRDLVYSFTLAQEKAVTITVTPGTGSTLRPAVYLRTVCDDRSSEVFAGCAAATAVGPATLTLPVLNQGTYFLWVDGGTSGSIGTAGTFNVSVTTSAPPTAPTGDTCATFKSLNLLPTSDPATTKASILAEDTTNARDNAQGVGLCAGGIAGDLVYQFTIGATQKVTATVTPDASYPAFQPLVFIRSTCASSADTDQLACGTLNGGASTAIANSLPQGTYYVWVDGAAPGVFKLEVVATTPVNGPANDTCTALASLAFTNKTATVSGTTVDAQNDTRSQQASYGANGGDVVYTFTLATTGPQRISATVVPGASAPAAFKPVVILRNQCGAILDLAAGQYYSATYPATATVNSANPGTFFVWVDTGGSPVTPGSFDLTVSYEVPNDQCVGAVALTAGTAVNGDTTDAVDQYGTTGTFATACTTALGTTTHTSGADVVYSYRPAAAGVFTVTVTPSATFDAIVWVTNATSASNCADVTACVNAADAAGVGGVETVSVTATSVRTFYIIVDSAQATSSGSFSIKVQ